MVFYMSLAVSPEISPNFESQSAINIPRARLALLHRIHKKYPTLTESIRFGAIEFPFTRIADPDQVLDDVVAEEDRREKTTGVRLADPPHLPYWAELWESARAIAQHLWNEPISSTTRVLDLGCGMGLAGAAAAAMGAQVVLADLETPALLLAKLNSLPYAPRVITRKLDWRKDTLNEKFDLILGSDILYDKSQWEHLDKFWKSHLAPQGRILLGEPGRQTGEMFIPWIAQRHDWLMRETFEIVNEKKRIRIFGLRRAV